ncbi:unnamed protein product, partial [Dicrocoelium dendriticum]
MLVIHGGCMQLLPHDLSGRLSQWTLPTATDLRLCRHAVMSSMPGKTGKTQKIDT